jgi:PTH1 family peptidyl-tRNA hydrolase
MKIVLGLGNPGAEHARDRHNVGAMVVDRMAAQHGVEGRRVAHRSHVAEVVVAGERVMLVKPQTYMNLSGEAAASVARYFQVGPESFVAVYDDMDLPLGRLRVRTGGGAAGHRGVLSLISHLGDEGFARVRVGIGRPPAGLDAASYVLTGFGPEEHEALRSAVALGAEAVSVLICEGATRAMNRFNGVTTGPGSTEGEGGGADPASRGAQEDCSGGRKS